MGLPYLKKLTQEQIAELWGGPLPELEQVYYDMAAEFERGRAEVAPYVMKKYYTLEEATTAMLLPGKAEQLAEKCGKTPEEMEQYLFHMARTGKIIKKEDGSYTRIPDIPYFKNAKHIQKEDRSILSQEGAKLIIAWDDVEVQEDGSYIGGRFPQTMRIVPKWEAIKRIPGVMPSENLPQIMRDNYDDLLFKECPCRVITSYARYGEDVPGMCHRGVQPTVENRDGVCIGFGARTEDNTEVMDAYHPTVEEMERMISLLEQSGTYYMTFNARETTNFCCCCDCCDCGVRVPYDMGVKDFFAKSRFMTTIADIDKCDGCGKCVENCNFSPAIQVVNGKVVLNSMNCHGCGNCVVQCDRKALKMKLVRPASHIPSIADYDPITFAPFADDLKTNKG